MPALIALLITLARTVTLSLSIARRLQAINRKIPVGGVFSSTHPLWRQLTAVSRVVDKNRKLLEKMPTILREIEGEISNMGQVLIGK